MEYNYIASQSTLENLYFENKFKMEKKIKVKKLEAEKDKLEVKISKLNTEIFIHESNIFHYTTNIFKKNDEE